MNLFDLQAKITLDSKGYENGIQNAKTGFGGLSAWTIAKGQLVADGLKTAGKAFIDMGKKAVESYADYEQLVGGVETLFKDSAGSVQEYAKNAYKTAGMSANAYMENVTSFSASLLQSLGGDTEAAGEAANQAMIDMSDNANKMGTSIDSIVMTYQSLSRGNFAMLDNLKLGYGGTKQELERLIADASKLDSSVDANDMSFGNIVKSIHAVQDEMGITGTTAKEASETISGSVSSMKGAWENLLVGVADESQDFEGLVTNFVDSVGTVAENILPRVQIALEGAGQLINEMIPVIINAIPPLITETLPTLLQSGADIINGIMAGLIDNKQAIIDGTTSAVNTLIDILIQDAPEFLVQGTLLIAQLSAGLIQAIPDLIARVPEIISAFVGGLWNNRGALLRSGVDLLRSVGEGIASVIETAKTWGRDLIDNFINGIKAKWNDLKHTIGQTAQSIKDYLGFSEPKKGPLSNFHTYAPDMMQLFASGIKENESLITRQIDKSFDFGEKTISANYNTQTNGTASAGSTQAKVIIGFDESANLMPLARALFPVLKIVSKEVTA